MTETFVVVGGDAAGMSAASKAKREKPDLDVVVFERGEWVSYANCGTPYYLKGDVPTLEDLVAVEPETFIEERDIDLRLHHEVVGIDPGANEVTVEGPDGEFVQRYDHLLVATGARAVEPPFEGMDLDGVFTLHGLDATAAVEEFIGGERVVGDDGLVDAGHAPDVQTAAVIGGGYVGIELAEAFRGRGLDVHLFEMLPHVLEPFGDEVAPTVEAELDAQGVALHLGTAVEGFVGADGRLTAVDLGAEAIDVDLAVVGVGVRPNTELAESAGIELGETGAIATDDYGRTNSENVYAAGDVAEATHVVSGAPAYVPLALTANRSGRAIGTTVAGTPSPVSRTAGTAALKAFDLEVARTGLLEDEARDHGFDPVSVTIEDSARAHYYPGATPLTVHLVGDRGSHRVLGAAMVGRESVAKRVDTVATALHAELTVGELESLDLSYAPPFSPVWDPVLTAAKVLAGTLD